MSSFPTMGFSSGGLLERRQQGSVAVRGPWGLSCVGLQLSPITRRDNSDYQITTENGPAGTGFFMRDTFLRTKANPQGEYKFDYAVDPAMFKVAQTINPVFLRCSSKTPGFCVPAQPVIRRGGRGLTGPIFLANENYRDYVFCCCSVFPRGLGGLSLRNGPARGDGVRQRTPGTTSAPAFRRRCDPLDRPLAGAAKHSLPGCAARRRFRAGERDRI